MLEEVAAGSDWSLAWTVLPITDPTEAPPMAAMNLDQYARAISLRKDYSLVADHRKKGQAGGARPNDKRGEGSAEKKGRRWIAMSEAQMKQYNEWKKKQPTDPP